VHQPVEINKESNLVKYALSELEIMGMLDTGDPIDQQMVKHILELLSVFSAQGHSGLQAVYLVTCIQKLMRFSPLSPLMGNEEEWIQVAEGLFQNRRCASVFKENGVAYDLEGKIHQYPDGSQQVSKTKIKFPYMPTKHIINAA
jgi:hypothetical protein